MLSIHRCLRLDILSWLLTELNVSRCGRTVVLDTPEDEEYQVDDTQDPGDSAQGSACSHNGAESMKSDVEETVVVSQNKSRPRCRPGPAGEPKDAGQDVGSHHGNAVVELVGLKLQENGSAIDDPREYGLFDLVSM